MDPHDKVDEKTFGSPAGARWGGGFFAQHEAQPAAVGALPPPRSGQGKRGFVGSRDDLDTMYAAWGQDYARLAGEAQARFRKG